MKTLGRIASIGVIAAVVLSAALAKWMQIEDARELADQTAPWFVYFIGFLIYAFLALGVILAVYICARLVRDKRSHRDPHV